MIEVVSYKGGSIRTTYFIYENGEEFYRAMAENKLSFCPKNEMIKVKVGNYILSDNGYYLPVVSIDKNEFYNRKTSLTYRYMHIQVPLKRFRFYILNRQVNIGKTFHWTRLEIAYHNKLTIKEKLIACYLSRGFSPIYAYQKVFKGHEKGKVYVYNKVSNLLNSTAFINYLRHVGGFKLSTRLKDKGLDRDGLLDIFKKKIDDPKTPAAILNYIFKQLAVWQEKESDPIDRSNEFANSRFISNSNDIEIKNKLEKQGLIMKED